jgi:membrane fusion protein (multidrug efflux system)
MRIAVYVITLLFFSCGNKTDDKKGKTSGKGSQNFSAMRVEPRSVTLYTDFPASIQGLEIVQIRPMVEGYLEQIFVDEGATVKKGELLFRINNPIYDQAVITARAAIKSAEADVAAATMDVEKVRPLVEKNIVSDYELKSAQYTLQSKEAALAQARANLANAQTNVGYTTIRSPINGVIGSIPYKIGDLISATNNPLTSLSNIDRVYAYFSLSEKQFLDFSAHVPGATLQDKLNTLPPVSLVLADGSQYPQKGKLETASGFISTATGTASIKAQFVNPTHIIRSGASAVVRIPHTIDTALLIPQSATFELQDKIFAYLVMPGNRVISANITTTPTNDGKFFIVHSGLKKGDEILTNGFNLKDSTIVTPRLINTDSLFNATKAH